MPAPITRDRLDELVEDGAQLVEVLPPHEYARGHIPGATNLPLKSLDPDNVGELDRDRPVIVYCSGFL